MKTPNSRLWILPIVALAAFLTLSAAWLDAFTSPTPAEFQRNYERWLDLSGAERLEIKARWDAWQSLDAEQQAVLKERMLTVMRVRASYGEEHEKNEDDVTDATLTGELERLVSLARRSVEEDDADPSAVRRALNRRSRKLALAYFDELVELGTIIPARRDSMAQLDTQALVARALKAAKDEAVAAARAARAASAEASDEQDDPEELEVLEPLDVIRRVDRTRERFGFHGPAGRAVMQRMTHAERTRFRDAVRADDEREAHTILLPYARSLANEHGASRERLDALGTMSRVTIGRYLNALMSKR